MDLNEQAMRWAEMGLNEQQIKTLIHIAQHGPISRKQYCELIGVSRMTAYRDLADLVKRDLLQDRGSGRYVHYILAEKM